MDVLRLVATIAALVGGSCSFILFVIRSAEWLKDKKIKSQIKKDNKAKENKIKDDLFKAYLKNQNIKEIK